MTASFSNRDSTMKLNHVGNGVWRGTWRPVNSTSDGSVRITVTAFQAQGVGYESNQLDLAGRLAGGNTPTVTSGGVVHAATDAVVPIAPGSLISIYGTDLADGTDVGSAPPLPVELQGAQVRFGDKVAPLTFARNDQLNVQIPFEIPVNANTRSWFSAETHYPYRNRSWWWLPSQVSLPSTSRGPGRGRSCKAMGFRSPNREVPPVLATSW